MVVHDMAYHGLQRIIALRERGHYRTLRSPDVPASKLHHVCTDSRTVRGYGPPGNTTPGEGGQFIAGFPLMLMEVL